MAKRRTRECKHFGCYNLTDSKSGYCSKHEGEDIYIKTQKRKEWVERTGYKRVNYATNKFEKFYSSKLWQDMRAYILARDDYLCQDCLKKNIIKQAREVHHIIFLTQDFNKRLDEKNLISLCHDCHQERHGKHRKIYK